MSTKKGLAIFGVDGHKAVKSEMTQLHDQDVMRIVTSTELLPSQKCEALAYLIFLERKHCGKIKGRGCADERKQCNKISKHESTSPTVSTESIFLSAVMMHMINVWSKWWMCLVHLCTLTWMTWCMYVSLETWWINYCRSTQEYMAHV